jgi:hypothetical protein
MAAVSGTIRRRIIKGSPARSGSPNVFGTAQIHDGLFTIPADA